MRYLQGSVNPILMTNQNRSAWAVGLALWAAGCSKPPEPPPPPPPEVLVVEVQPREVALERDFVGQVYGAADLPVRARVEGFLQGIHFSEGRRVRKGQLLYTIDPQPFQANVARYESQLAEAKIRAVRAENELERIAPLAKINAVSKSDLDAAVAEKGAAEAAVEAAEAALRLARIELGYTKVTAPTSGIIGKTNAKEGEFVGRSPNPVILNTVSRIDSVLVEFFIPEQDYLQLAKEILEKIKAGRLKTDDENHPLQLMLSDGSIYPYPGKVRFLDREVNPTTGSLRIQTVFPNPDRLIRPGQFAKVRVVMDKLENGLLIPQRCVSEFQGRFNAYVVAQDSVVQRELSLGPTYRDYWVVMDGLEPGDRVIYEGLQRVRPGAKVQPKLHEFESQAPAKQ